MVRKATYFSDEPCRFSLEFLSDDIDADLAGQDAISADKKLKILAKQIKRYGDKVEQAYRLVEQRRLDLKVLTAQLKSDEDVDSNAERDLTILEIDIDFFVRSINQENPRIALESINARYKALQKKLKGLKVTA